MPVNEKGVMPLLDFSDLDRDGMTDMIFYSNSSIYTFYNRYEANDATAASLCVDPREGSYLLANNIFTPILNAAND